MTAFISIQNLSHRYKVTEKNALEGINIDLAQSQIIGVVGPDGAGKTTFLRILTSLLKPTCGSCQIDQLDIFKDPLPENLIRYMPQKFGLYEDLTVKENIQLYADLNGLSLAEKAIAEKSLFDFTHLAPFQDRLAKDLSGGMKQKLGLGCVLLKKPKVLILDEPTVGVDPISRRELWKMIENLRQENLTIIISTSYLEEVENFDSVIILNEGKSLFYGSPKEIKKSIEGRAFLIKDLLTPKREALSDLILNEAVLDATIQGDSIRVLSKNNQQASCLDLGKKFGTILTAPAQFEDVFLDFIPDTSQKKSPIYSLYPRLEKLDKPLIEAKSLTKHFGSFKAVDQISFAVKQGEVFGLLGPNGAGKSTTFKMICGLLKPSSGEATIKELSLLNAPYQARSKIGYMAQKFSLYSNMTVLQNLRFFYGIYPLFSQKNHIVDEMIETFFLKPYLSSLTSDLPLGFKQRLALACAIMHRPEVLFLDEPTSGVDPITRREFWSHINALVSKNVAIVVTTHFMDEAEYCDRIGIVNDGKLVTIGTPDELKNLSKTTTNPHPSLEDAFIYLSTKRKENV